MNLAERSASLHEGAAVAEVVVVLFRQWFPCFPMTGHSHQGLVVTAPILHELTGKHDRVPLHIVDSGGLRMFRRGEHVLKPVAKLMKEGLHLFETNQTWDVSSRWGVVANQIGDRVGQLTLRSAGPG